MRYAGMPAGMWLLFVGSFRKKLEEVLGYTSSEAWETAGKAHGRYREIIRSLPGFEKADRFRMNIVNCALFSSFYLNMGKKPSPEETAAYYRSAMMTFPMRAFCRLSGKGRFGERDLRSMRETAALKAADRNPYSWNMDLLPYPDGSGYEARFSKCGICVLMKVLGIGEAVQAMCRLDYAMNEA